MQKNTHTFLTGTNKFLTQNGTKTHTESLLNPFCIHKQMLKKERNEKKT